MAPLALRRGRIVRMGLLVGAVSLARLVVFGVGCPSRLWWFRRASSFWPMPCLDHNA
jgi:hypothetical protein